METDADLDALTALPATWRAQLVGKTIVSVTSGMSGAMVFRISGGHVWDQYLKVGTGTLAARLRQEVERTEWLAAAGIRVPRVLAQHADRGVAAVLITALAGQTAEHLPSNDWRSGVTAIGRSLARLHSIAATTCPFDETIGIRLARARELVRSGGIDPTQFDDRNAGITPEELYDRLEVSVPGHEDCVVTHGDATLSNLIVANDGQVGFLDCGHCGRADRYVDLALLVGELEERFGAEAQTALVGAYGDLRWDGPKAEFYRDLYELF
jgi:aminoglycoside phosphotransferase